MMDESLDALDKLAVHKEVHELDSQLLPTTVTRLLKSPHSRAYSTTLSFWRPKRAGVGEATLRALLHTTE